METCEACYIRLRSFFREYASSYLCRDDDIRTNTLLKEHHTYRVCDFADAIASSLELGGNELCCAKIIALLHDIGRFEQYAVYRTFSDVHSENHSAIALRVIAENRLLDDITEKDKMLICRAIECHNMQNLPHDLEERTMIHAKIIRDADKLDIMPITLEYFKQRTRTKNPALEGKLPDTPGFSMEIVSLVAAGRTVSNGMRRNYNDLKLVQLSWMLDLNFAWSYRYALKQQYVEQLLCFLPDEEIIRDLGNNVKNVMIERGK
jgi:hypothetical protein